MNQERATAPEQSLFDQREIPFSGIPGQSELFLDFQEDADGIGRFYPEKNTPLEEYAGRVLEEYSVDRDKLCDILLEENKRLGGNIKTFLNIKKLRQTDCVAVVTGQQAGLFTGPVYTIYKALSAIKLAKALQNRGIRAVPVFWVAEEDHDFDEVKQTFFIDEDGKLAETACVPGKYRPDMPVGFIELDKSAVRAADLMFDGLQPTEFTDELKKMVAGAYRRGETYGSAFAKLLTRMLGDHGLIIVPALSRKLKKLCSPIFTAAVRRSDEFLTDLVRRNGDLEESGYHAQVLVEENSFPLFLQNEKRERLALRRDPESGKILIPASGEEIEPVELLEVAESYPQILSPNALLRPVVQDYLLPTVLYFGGSAEIAYFAQSEVIYRTLGRPVTPIRHRASLTVIRSRHGRTLENYRLELTDLFRGEERITARIVEEFLANDVAVTFAEVEENIGKELDRLEQSLRQTEPTLGENASNRRDKIMWHIAALRKKYHRAEILKDEVMQRRIQTLFAELLPQQGLQERTLNFLTFLNLYGPNLTEWLYAATEPEEKTGHQVIFF